MVYVQLQQAKTTAPILMTLIYFFVFSQNIQTFGATVLRYSCQCECALCKPCTPSLQIHGFWHVKDALINLLSRDEVFPRSNLSLSFAGTTLDPLAELQGLKGLKPGAVLRLVEGNSSGAFLTIIHYSYQSSHLNTRCVFRN